MSHARPRNVYSSGSFFCAGLKMVCLIPKAIPEQAINRLHFTTLLNDIPFD